MPYFSFLSSTKRARSRRRGASMVLFLAALPVIIGACGIVIDVGMLHNRRAEAQRAADAAALAGAWASNHSEKDGYNSTQIETEAQKYALLNGYDHLAPGTQVQVTPEYNADGDGNGYLSKVKVRISRDETVFFTPILEGLLLLMGQREAAANYSRRVSTSATASKVARLPLAMGGAYGIADPSASPATQGVFGPDAYYNFGDPWNTRFLEDGVTPNPQYKAEPDQGGHEYTMKITDAYLQQHGNKVKVEVFDPDSYSKDGINGTDEDMPANANLAQAPTGSRFTETVYEIYKNGVLVNGNARAQYGGYDGDAALADAAGTNEQWVTPPNFELDLSNTALGTGDYTIRVKALSGSTENGYRLRAGPPQPQGQTPLTDVEWNNLYGDKGSTDPSAIAVPIEADNHLQMNFSKDGMVKFRLGYVSPQQTNGSLGVRHFDVDVGSQSIVYTCDALPGQTFVGDLGASGERNGAWITDNIALPESYQGGNWYAEYVAGAQDTSSWELLGGGTGSGYVRLTE